MGDKWNQKNRWKHNRLLVDKSNRNLILMEVESFLQRLELINKWWLQLKDWEKLFHLFRFKRLLLWYNEYTEHFHYFEDKLLTITKCHINVYFWWRVLMFSALITP